MWSVVFHPAAEKELGALATPDRVAVLHAVEKLAALGPALPHPHQSDVGPGRALESCGHERVGVEYDRCTGESATPSWSLPSGRKRSSTGAGSTERYVRRHND